MLIVALVFVTTETNIQAATFTPVFYYYHSDHLGSSNVLTDRDGLIVQHYEHGAFGNERFKDNTSAVAMSHRYTGQILDEETGLYYYNARYYDPELARFTQADTIVPEPGDPQTLNRYAYASNNPLKYTDPTGHETFFGGLHDAIFNSFNTPLGLFTFNLSSPAVSISQTTVNYLVDQALGPKAAYYGQVVIGYINAVATIVVGVLTVWTGAGVYLIAAGILQITSGALSIAATTAEISGNEQLANALGWAAFGTGLAAMVAGLIGLVAGNDGNILTGQDELARRYGNAVYGDDTGGELGNLGIAYRPRHGFGAAVYLGPDGVYYAAFRGTQPTSGANWVANFKQALGFRSSQYQQAIDLAQQINRALEGYDVVFVGHSLGGGMASAASHVTGRNAITFNAAGLTGRYLTGVPGQVRAHYIRGDILSTAQDFTPLPNAVGARIAHPARNWYRGPIGRHLMNNFAQP